MIIDSFLNRDREFWKDLETFCVAECCGIDAFDFSDKNLEETIQHYDQESILKNLDQLLVFLKTKKSNTVSILSWNYTEKRDLFIKRIENIKRVLLRVSV